MQLRDYLTRFCVIPTQMAQKMKVYHNVIFRIIRDGNVPSLAVALRIEDFTNGKVTPREIYNECQELKKKALEKKNRKNAKKNQD